MKYVKVVCDLCKGPMPEPGAQYYVAGQKFKNIKVNFSMTGSVDNIIKDICKYCLIDMANSLDDRPVEKVK